MGAGRRKAVCGTRHRLRAARSPSGRDRRAMAATLLAPARAKGVERSGGSLVATLDQLRPAAAVDEQIVERGPAQKLVISRVDHRQRVAERSTPFARAGASS